MNAEDWITNSKKRNISNPAATIRGDAISICIIDMAATKCRVNKYKIGSFSQGRSDCNTTTNADFSKLLAARNAQDSGFFEEASKQPAITMPVTEQTVSKVSTMPLPLPLPLKKQPNFPKKEDDISIILGLS